MCNWSTHNPLCCPLLNVGLLRIFFLYFSGGIYCVCPLHSHGCLKLNPVSRVWWWWWLCCLLLLVILTRVIAGYFVYWFLLSVSPFLYPDEWMMMMMTTTTLVSSLLTEWQKYGRTRWPSKYYLKQWIFYLKIHGYIARGTDVIANSLSFISS